MTPEQREELVQAIGGDCVAWAGIVGEMEGKLAVHAFVNDTQRQQRELTIGGRAVAVMIEQPENSAWLATQMRFESILTLPGVDGTLRGPVAADALSERMNAAVRDPAQLRHAVCEYARRIGAAVQGMGGHVMIFTALRARALAGYVMQNNRLPNQEQYEQFVGQRNEPWAIALRQPRHTRQNIAAEVLQLQHIRTEAEPNPFADARAIVGWIDGRSPLYGFPPPEDAAVAEAEEHPLDERAQAIALPIRIEDLPPFAGERDVPLRRIFNIPIAPDIRSAEERDPRRLYPGLGV